MILTNKVKLQDILTPDIDIIVDLLYERELITRRGEYIFTYIFHGYQSAASSLLDNILGQGEERCSAFLNRLNEEDVLELCPALKAMPWYVDQTKNPGQEETHSGEGSGPKPEEHEHIVTESGMENKAYLHILKNKVNLQGILMSDIENLLELLCQRKVITRRQRYAILCQRILGGPTTALVDKIMDMGEERCNAFLDVLKGEDVIQMYPDLKTMPWYVNQTKNAVMG